MKLKQILKIFDINPKYWIRLPKNLRHEEEISYLKSVDYDFCIKVLREVKRETKTTVGFGYKLKAVTEKIIRMRKCHRKNSLNKLSALTKEVVHKIGEN